jgi:diaminopimelate dehydrogenase
LVKTRVVLVGFGSVGKEVICSVNDAPDMEMAGIIVRKPDKMESIKTETGLPVAMDITRLENVNVAILAIPSRSVPVVAPTLLEQGISTVDCYDIHGESLLDLYSVLEESAVKGGVAAMTGAGWDPGTDSIFRGVFELIAPKGITYTNFGPGISMGHTVAIKKIPGVKDAISLTLPIGHGLHKRAVYVVLKEGFDINDIRRRIFEDEYFQKDNTTVEPVEEIDSILDLGHGVRMERKGASGKTYNQRMSFEMTVMNPAATAQVMVSAARGVVRQKPGCYTLLDIPIADCLPGDHKSILKRLV